MRRVCQYTSRKGIAIDFERPLGDGTDGYVWGTLKTAAPPSAVKIHVDAKTYVVERECYLLLRRNQVKELKGFAIPELIDYADISRSSR
jgi:hypothetical protein